MYTHNTNNHDNNSNDTRPVHTQPREGAGTVALLGPRVARV